MNSNIYFFISNRFLPIFLCLFFLPNKIERFTWKCVEAKFFKILSFYTTLRCQIRIRIRWKIYGSDRIRNPDGMWRDLLRVDGRTRSEIRPILLETDIGTSVGTVPEAPKCRHTYGTYKSGQAFLWIAYLLSSELFCLFLQFTVKTGNVVSLMGTVMLSREHKINNY